jgi:hypothetical protein
MKAGGGGHNRNMRSVAVLVVALTLAGAAGGSLRPKPSIRFVSLVPATAKGAHFLSGQRVRVTLSAGTDTRLRVVRTGETGTFVVRFGTLAAEDRCSGKISLLAVGSRGDRAWFRLPTLNCPTLPPP